MCECARTESTWWNASLSLAIAKFDLRHDPRCRREFYESCFPESPRGFPPLFWWRELPTANISLVERA